MKRWASIVEPYRYELGRQWSGNAARVCWVMLNPSTADETVDDPTIRRCIGFSRTWGYGGLVVVNLFALRATDPTELYRHHNPIGPENDAAIQRGALSELLVAAWGTHGAFQRRGLDVARAIKDIGCTLHHLGLTREGHPKHPLYLRKSTMPQPWELPS